ncbi:MAG: class I SAM-dependent methyltransferase [Candidatus Promineifilaceae bacterium]
MTDTLWDDPQRDFRQRYQLPVHFTWDQNDLPAIDYRGYIAVTKSLLPAAPSKLLDVGCGDGFIAAQLLEEGYQVTGVDYSDRAIAFANILVPNGDFQVGDVRELAKQAQWAGAFDSAIFIEVLEHIPPEYHLETLRAIGQCLKVGGTLIMSVPSVNIPVNRWHYKHFERDEGQKLCEEAGFKVTKVVNQLRVSPLTHPRLWRYLNNPLVDFKVVRRRLGQLLLNRFNTTDNPADASRYIYQLTKS